MATGDIPKGYEGKWETAPTQVQIEAAGIEAVKDELDFQRSKGSIKALGLEWVLNRLTAAAEVGWQDYPFAERDLRTAEHVKTATIERCAKIAETLVFNEYGKNRQEIAAAIRAMKDGPPMHIEKNQDCMCEIRDLLKQILKEVTRRNAT